MTPVALHIVPDDGRPHAPTSECGCDPELGVTRHRGAERRAYLHHDQDHAGDQRQEGTDHAAARP